MKNEIREHEHSKVGSLVMNCLNRVKIVADSLQTLYQLSPYEVKELLTDLLAEEYSTKSVVHDDFPKMIILTSIRNFL